MHIFAASAAAMLLAAAPLDRRPGVALAQAYSRVPASVLSTGPMAVHYVTGSRGAVVLQVDGIGLAGARGITLDLRSARPTQVRVYAIPERGPGRFRYVVFTPSTLRRTLRVPLDAFDEDVRGGIPIVPRGGALMIVDCAGMLRRSLTNSLSVGPLALTTAAPPWSPDEVPPGPESDGDDLYRRILGGWIGKVSGGSQGIAFEGKLAPQWEWQQRLGAGLLPIVWGMGPDDDTSFEVQHLLVARATGGAFTSADLVESWKSTFAYEYLWKTGRHVLDCLDRGIHPRRPDGDRRARACARASVRTSGACSRRATRSGLSSSLHATRPSPIMARGSGTPSSQPRQ